MWKQVRGRKSNKKKEKRYLHLMVREGDARKGRVVRQKNS